MKPTILVLSCDHASNHVPVAYQLLFAQEPDILNSYLAYDLGARSIGHFLSAEFSCDYIETTVTRLLVDTTKAPLKHHCFSDFTKDLPQNQRQKLLNEFYFPYRKQATDVIHRHVERGEQVLHVAVHTFAPVHDGVKRNAGFGLLYDPTRHAEREVARVWRRVLLQQKPTYNVRLNYPFSGKSDCLGSLFRKQYDEASYLSIELEINQTLLDSEVSIENVKTILSTSIRELLQIL